MAVLTGVDFFTVEVLKISGRATGRFAAAEP
jgi:hypothetical protein